MRNILILAALFLAMTGGMGLVVFDDVIGVVFVAICSALAIWGLAVADVFDPRREIDGRKPS